jgi:hypothetical protein
MKGSFTATGRSDAASVRGKFNVSGAGDFVGTVQLQRRFLGDNTWYPVSKNVDGDPVEFSGPFSVQVEEIQVDVDYALECTAYTSGTLNYNIGQ